MRRSFVRSLMIWMLTFILFLSGCGSSDKTSAEPPTYSPAQVLVPEAPLTETLGFSPLLLDISNIAQGYLTAISDSKDTKMNVRLSDQDNIVYSYSIAPGESAVIPFSSGSGTYQVCCYQQIDDTQYAALFADTLKVQLDNEFLPFLYPNQYVNFSPGCKASETALSIVPDDATDIEVLQSIYAYVTQTLTYDSELAQNVAAGYLPDLNQVLLAKKGICFDYAALTTAMLRSRDIPCKLQIGYAGTVKHAWINVYIRSKGWVDKAIEFSGDSWSRMDPTFDSNSEDKETIQQYIRDDENYIVQFTR